MKKTMIVMLFISALLLLVSHNETNEAAQILKQVSPTILTQQQIEISLAELPTGEQWIKHLEDDLMPFWTIESALGGTDMGNFPSYRDNQGNLIDWTTPKEQLPPEIQGGLYLGLVFPYREYLRTRSRQIFGYCIAFQMTGEKKYLDYAYAGIKRNYLQEGSYYNDEDGTLYAWLDTRTNEYVCGTSQDWAYGLSGPAYYYYVTKDEQVLALLLKSRKKLRETFFDPDFGMYRWSEEESGVNNRREIVSNLDQIYGYMLFLYRSLPAQEQSIWKKELHDIAVILLKEFQDSRDGFFWGQAGKTTEKFYGSEHTDFGHSTKTYWLLMQIGRLTDDPALERIGRDGAVRLVDTAYDRASETWNQKLVPNEDGSTLVPVRDRDWWSLAIMDQTAATLSLRDPDFLRYISKTHRFWLDSMLDPRQKEMWHLLKADSIAPDIGFPKQHAWKTCFHSTEHALVMYLTAQQLRSEPASLHFVRSVEDYANPKEYYPYIFEGEVKQAGITVCSKPFELHGSAVKRVHVNVSFNSIR